MNFPCPPPAAFTDIVNNDCPFRFDQIVKLVFFQRKAAAPFANLAAMKLLATWTPLLSAADDTQIAPTPIFSGLVIPESEGQFVGGNDNTTFNGIREYYGENMVTVTGVFKNLQPAVKASLDDLTQFSIASATGRSNLLVMMINKDGYIFMSELVGFDCYNFRIGSVGSQGLKSPNTNTFSFDLPEGWDKKLATVKPTDFDPLTALIN